MGILDKIGTKLKNVDSKASQKADEAKIDSEIKKRRAEIDKYKIEIGEAYYVARKEGMPSPESEMDAIYGKIAALEDEIEELECEKERIIAEGEAEREANRKASG